MYKSQYDVKRGWRVQRLARDRNQLFVDIFLLVEVSDSFNT